MTASVSGTAIALGWGAPFDVVTSYQLEVGSASGLSNIFNGDVGRVTTLTASVAPGTYFFRVRAKSACGASVTSNEATARVGSAITMTFAGLQGQGSAFTSYTESGFTVASTAASWTVSTGYGNPPPFIQFQSFAGNTVTGEIRVTAGGSAFSFSSVDIYSSTTTIPYTFTGLLSSNTVFVVTGTVPNTFGRFANVPNSYATTRIDTLLIRLSNAAAPCCSNPMGVDNIVVSF